MLALVMPDGPVRRALERGASAAGETVSLFDGDLDELFLAAMKSRAIVYAPTAGGAEERSRLEEVLSAMSAPGRRRLVLIMPEGQLSEVLQPVRRSGVPYVLLGAPPVLEAIAEQLEARESRRWWFPSDERRRVTAAAEVADAVARALEAPDDGIVESIPGEVLSLPELARRALGAPARVHGLPRPLYRAALRLGLLRTDDARRWRLPVGITRPWPGSIPASFAESGRPERRDP